MLPPRSIIFIITIFFARSLFAQDASEIPALLQRLKANATDTARVRTLSLLSFHYSRENSDSSLLLGNEALELAKKIDYKRGIAEASNSVGWTYFCKDDYEKAKEYLNRSYQLFKELGLKELMGKPLNNLGNIYLNESDYAQALLCYKEALQHEEEVHNETLIGRDLYNIGKVYNMQHNSAEARKYFQQAVVIHKKLGNDLYLAETLSSIGNSYQFDGKFDTALIYYKQILPIYTKHRDLYRLGNVNENIGIAYQNKGDYLQAIKYMLQAKQYYEQIHSELDMAYASLNLGDIYNSSGNYAASLSSYKEAAALAHTTSSKDLERLILLGMAYTYEKLNDYKNAYIMLDSSGKIKDSLFTKDKENELLKLQTQFETERKEKENQLLKAQNAAATAQLREREIFLIAAIAGIVMLSVLLYLLYRNRQTKIKNIETLRQLNKQLEEQKEEISRINALLELKALRAQMNPHFIFNCMSSIQECMLTGRLDEANTYLSKLSRLLRMVLVHSDDENITLSKELEMLSLYLELESLRFKGSFTYNIETDEEILPEDILVPALILQPFAENAIWHGLLNKPVDRKLNICIEVRNDMLYCVVEDNGIGREKSMHLKSKHSKHDSRGMKLIEKRLAILRQQSGKQETGVLISDLYNTNKEACGTKVEIILPVLTM